MALLLQSGRLGWRHIVAPGSAVSACCSSPFREYSAAPSSSQEVEDDIVLKAFKEQQRHYREFMEGMKKINIPLNGDEGAVKKYATEVEALKKKIGMPPAEQVINATLDYQMSISGYNVRKFINTAVEGMDLGPYGSVVEELTKAVDEIEQETGAPLDGDNDKGWDSLRTKIENIQKQHGLDDYNKIKDQATLDMYKQQLGNIRQKAIDDMDFVKRRDGLEFVNVDPAQIDFKL